MATAVESQAPQRTRLPTLAESILEHGDRVSRDEFERRYSQLRHLKKAELIEGTVYIPSPVRAQQHAEPHSHLATWLGVYVSETAGVKVFDNTTVRLDLDNEPQPDLILIKPPEKGGHARISTDDFIEGAPELAVEIAGSSRAYDLHPKKTAYRRNGIVEYLVWITGERRFIWWELREGDYHEIPADATGVIKSKVFPGLWLNTAALLDGNLKAALETLHQGLASAEHKTFVGS